MSDWDLDEYVRQIDEHLGDAANALRGLREHLRRVEELETPAQDAHTPREQPQTRSGGTESGEGGGGAQEGGLRVMHCGDMEGHAVAYNEGFTEGSAGEQRAREAIEWLRQVIGAAPLSRDTVLDIITDALDGPEVIAAEEALDGASSKAAPDCSQGCSGEADR